MWQENYCKELPQRHGGMKSSSAVTAGDQHPKDRRALARHRPYFPLQCQGQGRPDTGPPSLCSAGDGVDPSRT